MKTSKNINCAEVERRLITDELKKLSPEKVSLIKNHINSCERCQSFQHLIVNLQQSLHISEKNQLTPNPIIKKRLLQKMKESKTARKHFFQTIIDVLEFRIPVYHALAGVIILLLIFWGIEKISFSFDWREFKQNYFSRIEIPVSSPIYTVDNLKVLEQQKIGKTVKEDSLLARYIVPSM